MTLPFVVIEVELVEVNSLHQVADCFRLKGGHFRFAEPREGLEVSSVERLEQHLGVLDDVTLRSSALEQDLIV